MNENVNEQEVLNVVATETAPAAVKAVAAKEEVAELVVVDSAVTGTAHDAFTWDIGKRAKKTENTATKKSA